MRILYRCIRCRERKVKCSGSLPCQNCSSRSVECAFDPEDKKVVVSERQVISYGYLDHDAHSVSYNA